MPINLVVIEGNLTRDPEIKHFANGGSVCNFSIAHNVPKKNASTGQWDSEPHFFDVAAFNNEKRKLADLCMERLKKGSKVTVEGRLKQERWEAQDGSNRSKVSIIVGNISFERKSGESAKNSEGGDDQQAGGEPRMRQGVMLADSPMDDNIPF